MLQGNEFQHCNYLLLYKCPVTQLLFFHSQGLMMQLRKESSDEEEEEDEDHYDMEEDLST